MREAAEVSSADRENQGAAVRHPLILLIGYRCTGKTTVARLLADRLGWHWLDADEVLEKRRGRSIVEIFQQDGESAFRELETAILAELCALNEHVIATGGGVILQEGNRSLLRRSGQVVWLTADVETIWQRLQADASSGKPRPLLSVGGRVEVEQMLRAREPLYRESADIIVDTRARKPEQIVDEIASVLFK